MNWEVSAVEWANGLAGRSQVFDTVMWHLSDGRLLFVGLAILLAVWVWFERQRAAVSIATITAAVLIGDFIGARIKDAVGRPRPCRVFEVWNDVGGCGGAFAMPSNHVLNLAVGAACLHVLHPRTGWVLWPLVAIQAFNRMFMAAHYPTDVIAGAAIGTCIGLGFGFALKRWLERRSPEPGRRADLATDPSGGAS